MKKALAWLLTLVLLMELLPLSASATGGELTGDGTEANPYEIADADDLMAFAAIVNDDGDSSACAQLMADIDMGGYDWLPIGADASYSGTFSGNNWTIINLSITADSSYMDNGYYSAGLFGSIDCATIQDVRVQGEMTITDDGYCDGLGGIVGSAYSGNTISNCLSAVSIYVQGEVIGAGGIVGYMGDDGNIISGCVNWGDILEEYDGGYGGFGGIVGYSDMDIDLGYCYNRGSIVCTGSDSMAGGLVGYGGSALNLTGCYSSASLDDAALPGDLVLTGQISGQGFCGDLAGVASYFSTAEHCISCCDILATDIFIYDFDTLSLAGWFSTAQEMADYLNTDNLYYVIPDNSYGDGWPALAWELENGQAMNSPQEKAVAKAKKALEDAKTDALNALDKGKTIGSTKYVGYNTYQFRKNSTNDYYAYSDASWELLSSFYTNARTAISNTAYREPDNWTELEADIIAADGEAQAATVTELANSGVQNMASVPTKQQETQLASDIVSAQSAVSSTYKKELVKLDGYRAQLSAVWHEQSREALTVLTGKEALLRSTLDDAIAALGESRTQTALKAAKTEWNEKLLDVLGTYSVPIIDSGVAAKWDGVSKTAPALVNGTYQIADGAQLAWFAEAVNTDSNSANAVLTADIDLAGHEWTPIGVKGTYSGVFDGQGHLIHGISSTAASGPQGLFGTIGADGVVKNLRAAGTVSAAQANGSGLIAGTCSGVIANCQVSAAIKNTKGNGQIGGVVGNLQGGMVDNCRAWGLFLPDDSSYVFSSVGGIVGSAGCSDPSKGCMIRYCENHLTLRSYESSYLSGNGSRMGGIVGQLHDCAHVRECANYADLRGGNFFGGIVGSADGTDIRIFHVVNYGEIWGGKATSTDNNGNGGIAGQLRGGVTLEYAWNAGTVYGDTNRNKLNTETQRSTSAARTGGIVGSWQSGCVQHVRSSSENTLWGYAAATDTNSTDTARVDTISPEVNTNGGLWAKTTATQALLSQLIYCNARSEKYSIYGDQSAAYNAVVMQHIRQIELAADAGAVTAALREAEAALASVPDGLTAAKTALRQDMDAFIQARLYDADGQQELDVILAEADAAIPAASTLSAVADLRKIYLGSDAIDGKLAQVMVYPVKAGNELYNLFIYGKAYAQANAAAMLRAYEGWQLKLDAARTLAEAEAIYAEARKALSDLAATLTQGDTQPDTEQAAKDALVLARQEILSELAEKETQYADALAQQLGDLSRFSADWQKRLNSALNAHKAALHSAAVPDLESITAYAQLEAIRLSALAQLADIHSAAESELARLLASAGNSTAWDGSSLSEPETVDGVYQIGTAAELAWFAAEVNRRGNLADAVLDAVLTADIDLGYQEWTPIGSNGTSGANYRPFRASFDGQGHTVSGLYISRTGTGYAGLFGELNGAKIHNLHVDGTIELTDVQSTVYAGGLAANARSSSVSSCTSSVVLSVSFKDIGGRTSCLGGLLGSMHTTDLADCRFDGSAEAAFGAGSTYLGFGGNGGLGGITGYVHSGAFTRCVNAGSVTADKASGVGGIAGATGSFSSASTNVHFFECVNTGHITNDAQFTIAVGDSPVGGVGGILGVSHCATLIERCYNTGTITGGIIAGGILGGERGSYGRYSDSGTDSLIMRSCYNAGLIDTGTKTDRIGSLVGFPISGTYRDELYVLSGTFRQAMGWKSSQGDCVTILDTLSADLIGGMVDSIAALNGGHPLFPWQLLSVQSRQAVNDYLQTFYREQLSEQLTAGQRSELEAMLTATAQTINGANDAQAIIDAYHAAMNAMDAKALLDVARSAALDALHHSCDAAKVRYPQLEAELTEACQAAANQIAACESGSDAEKLLDLFAAQIVDLLITHAQSCPVGALDPQLTDIQSAYEALTPAQQAQVNQYAVLAQLQELLALYQQDLALLIKWHNEDSRNYADLSDQLDSLYAEAAKALHDCTAAQDLADVLDGCCADVVGLLIEDVCYQEGQTAMGKLNAKKLARAKKALDGLSNDQLALLGSEAAQDLVSAENLLAVYEKAGQTLESWLAEDLSRDAAHADELNALALQAEAALADCVDKSGAEAVLARYRDAAAALAQAKPAPTPGVGNGTGDNAESGSGEATAPTGDPTVPDEPDTTPDKPATGADNQTPDTDQPTAPASFDWSIVWMTLGVVCALAAIAGLLLWFAAAKKKKKN